MWRFRAERGQPGHSAGKRHGPAVVVAIPGPQAHAMKLGFEKYFLWKARHSYVTLP